MAETSEGPDRFGLIRRAVSSHTRVPRSITTLLNFVHYASAINVALERY